MAIESVERPRASAHRLLNAIRDLSPRGSRPWRTQANIQLLTEVLDELDESEALEHVHDCAEVARARPDQWRWWSPRRLFRPPSAEIWQALVAEHRAEQERIAERAANASATKAQLEEIVQSARDEAAEDPGLERVDPQLRRLAQRFYRVNPPQLQLFGEQEVAKA